MKLIKKDKNGKKIIITVPDWNPPPIPDSAYLGNAAYNIGISSNSGSRAN